MLDELRRVFLFSSGVAELTRNRADDIVKNWVRDGEIRRDQAASAVKNLLETSRRSRQDLLDFVKTEIEHQVRSMGLVTTRDLARLERRIARLEGGAKSPKKTARKKPAARKTQV